MMGEKNWRKVLAGVNTPTGEEVPQEHGITEGR
jgi:hypothetical protein